MSLLERVLLLGAPVGHSLSPIFQNVGFAAAGLGCQYEVCEVSESQLGAMVAAIRRQELVGANVTVPWKQAVVAHVDRLSYTARRAGAVNTLVRTVYGVEGHNTDVAGLRRWIAESLPAGARGLSACIVGAGGTTRAAIVALDQLEFGQVAVVNRTSWRAEELVASLRSEVLAELSAWPLSSLVGEGVPPALWDVDLVLHTTSAGVGSMPDEPLWEELVASWGELPWASWRRRARVLDVCYGRQGTPFVATARGHGLVAKDGLDMLLYQGVESFVLWTSVQAPEAAMKSALYAAAGRTLEG